MNAYVPLLAMIIAAGGLAVVGIIASELLGKATADRYNSVKNLSYECGVEATPVAENSARFPVKYYITAMIFLLFDIEVVFLYPWSVTFETLGPWGLIEMLSFLVLLTLPFIYVWRRGGLEWD